MLYEPPRGHQPAPRFVQVCTPLAAQRSPTEVFALLNRFFGVVIEVVASHGGRINKFEGDAALAVFGAPEDIGDPAGRALAAARELATRLSAQLPDAFARTLSYDDQTFTVSDTITAWPAARERLANAVRTEMMREYPVGFGALAVDTAKRLDETCGAHERHADTGPGWYLPAGRPTQRSRPSWSHTCPTRHQSPVTH